MTPASVKGALARLKDMKPDDLAVVFLAGHGVARRTDGAMQFLTASSGFDERSQRAGAIAWSDLASSLAESSGRTLVLLDACHSGHISQDVIVPNAALASSLERSGRSGAVVFAAAKGRQMSYEPDGQRGFHLAADGAPSQPPIVAGTHGFFSAAVIDVLRQVTDHDGDGMLQLSELVYEVTRRVAARTAGQQTPWLARRESFGDYGLAGATRR